MNLRRTGPARHVLGLASRLVLALSLTVASGLAAAEPEQIQSTTTSMSSLADRMISYRSQEHMWQTADGATHVIINRGPRRDRRSLALYSTYDGGANWEYANVSLPGSNGSSTSDGYLVGDRLHITWDIGASTIRYTELNYHPETKVWSMDPAQTVFDSDAMAALTPAMAVDRAGRQWLAFTAKDTASGEFSIKMMRRNSPTDPWVDTGFVFGTPDNLANERSGRPIITSRGMGMVFTVKQEMFWAERRDDWALDQPWARAPIYTKTEPTNDPYGTHFSIVHDADYNFHMVSTDGFRLLYTRYLVSDRKWVTRVMTDPIKASYVQATIADGNVMLFTNAYTTISVFQSADNGDNFVRTHSLVHPAPAEGESYNRPRLETPSVSTGPVPVLQQYVKGKRQGAIFFAVPVVADPIATGGALR